MKLLTRFFLILLVIITGLIAAFYFWGQSANLEPTAYTGIESYPVKEKTTFPDTLSVMTYNIGYLSGMTNNLPVQPAPGLYSNHLDKAIQLIGGFSPDFVGFQEIDFNSKRSFYTNRMDSIAYSLNYGFGALAVNWDKKYVPFPYWPVKAHFGRMLSGQAVLSKYPVLVNRRVVLPKPASNPFYYNAFYLDRLVQLVEIEFGSHRLMLLNVHLEAFDSETREEQARVIATLLDDLGSDHPLLMIGDLNSTPPFEESSAEMESTISTILETGILKSAVSRGQYKKEPSSYYTFSSADPEVMIDYIFYNEKIRPLRVEVVRDAETISDHLPVLFKFMIKNN